CMAGSLHGAQGRPRLARPASARVARQARRSLANCVIVAAMRPNLRTGRRRRAAPPTIRRPTKRRPPRPSPIDAERIGWTELTGLVRRLTPAQCLVPGYYRDPDWSVRDMVGHIGTWLAMA